MQVLWIERARTVRRGGGRICNSEKIHISIFPVFLDVCPRICSPCTRVQRMRHARCFQPLSLSLFRVFGDPWNLWTISVSFLFRFVFHRALGLRSGTTSTSMVWDSSGLGCAWKWISNESTWKSHERVMKESWKHQTYQKWFKMSQVHTSRTAACLDGQAKALSVLRACSWDDLVLRGAVFSWLWLAKSLNPDPKCFRCWLAARATLLGNAGSCRIWMAQETTHKPQAPEDDDLADAEFLEIYRCLPKDPCIVLNTYTIIYLYLHLRLHIHLHLSICLSICLSIYLSIYLSMYIYIYK